MEDSKKFNYETAENKKGTDFQETMVKILQVIVGFIMAVLHM